LGIIEYPTYQVVVAREGDTVTSIANRLGLTPNSLASYNGVSREKTMRAGEVLALPKFSETAARQSAEIDVSALTQSALAKVETSQASKTPQPATNKDEPIRHKVRRGETAFTISRLYNVSIRSLSEWNGLDSNFTIREDQYLLIPLMLEVPVTAPKTRPEKPGQGSQTPLPPSSSSPLPKAESATTSQITPLKEKTPVQETVATTGKLTYPVNGKIIREYVKGKTEGIDLSAPAGSTIVAAETGTVAAITADVDQVPIVVIKHANELLTVYANVGNISVSKGAQVSRGQAIGKIPPSNPTYLHFEVRQGLESVDPLDYLQ
ncbi:MAG: peptidoglycan DD-metalloendopeptidase family protein, partial [Paracoccaceae bacterium]